MADDRQLAFLFEEGGITDDGMDRDPLSGNEVPPGSLAEEVRDDIPAQLSEGEYVVPADVVRFFGVRFFEQLRSEAKQGLAGMEREGRIGGEPMGMAPQDSGLTPEEEQELASIIGMAVGGMVTEQPTQATNPYMTQADLYRAPAPVAIGNAGYAEGGTVTDPTQFVPDLSQYAAGYTFMGQPTAATAQPPATSVTPYSTILYGPNGQVVSLILPTQQAQYDALLAQGYTVEAPVAQQAAQPADDGRDPFEAQRSLRERMAEGDTSGAGLSTFSQETLARIDADPIGYANEMLERDTLDPRYGLAAGALGGPAVGVVASGALMGVQLESIARARAARNIAAARGLDTTELDASIAAALEDLPRGARLLEQLGFGTGRRYQQAIEQGLMPTEIGTTFSTPEWLPEAATARQAANARIENLTGSAAEYAEGQLRSGYTGSTVGGIAIGQISGDGQIAGVVANPDGTVVKDSQNRTVFRDEEGRTYVRTGILGRDREYVTIEGVVSSPEVEMPETPTVESIQQVAPDEVDITGNALPAPGFEERPIFEVRAEQAIAEAEQAAAEPTQAVTPEGQRVYTEAELEWLEDNDWMVSGLNAGDAIINTDVIDWLQENPVPTEAPAAAEPAPVAPTPEAAPPVTRTPTPTTTGATQGPLLSDYELRAKYAVPDPAVVYAPPAPDRTRYGSFGTAQPTYGLPAVATGPAPQQPLTFGMGDTRPAQLPVAFGRTDAERVTPPGMDTSQYYIDQYTGAYVRRGTDIPYYGSVEQLREMQAVRGSVADAQAAAAIARTRTTAQPELVGYGPGQIDPMLARAAGITGGYVPRKEAEPDPATLREPAPSPQAERFLSSRFQTDEDKLREASRRLDPDAAPLAVPAQTVPAAKELEAPLDLAPPSIPAPKETDREPAAFSQPTPVSKPAPVREEPDRPAPSKSAPVRERSDRPAPSKSGYSGPSISSPSK